MKRTFIPPSHRPFVKGAVLGESSRESEENLIESLHDTHFRRRFILDVIQGNAEIPGQEKEHVRQSLLTMFPMLGGVDVHLI